MEKIEQLIKEKEEKFYIALSRNADTTILNELKKDLEFFRQKRAEIFKNSTAGNKTDPG